MRDIAVGGEGGLAFVGERLDENEREAIQRLAIPGAVGDLPRGDGLAAREGRGELGVGNFVLARIDEIARGIEG